MNNQKSSLKTNKGGQSLIEKAFNFNNDFEFQKNNIVTTKYDNRIFNEIKSESNEINYLINKKEDSPLKDIVSDFFNSHYQIQPEMADIKKIAPSARGNRQFIERYVDTLEYKKLHSETINNPILSAMATLIATRSVYDQVEHNEDLKKAFEDYKKASNSEGDNFAPMDGNGDPLDTQASQIANEAQESMNRNIGKIRQAMKKAAQESHSETSKINASLAGWGISSEELNSANVEDREILIQYLRSDDIRKISNLVGKLRRIASDKKNKIKVQSNSIHGVTIGNNLSKVLPSELAMAALPITKAMFYQKYNEKKLLQYDIRNREKSGKGPMIIAIDCSGSMQGERSHWAIAIAMGLINEASKENRACYIIFFNGNIQKEIYFEKGQKTDVHKFMEIASVGTSGGTNFEKPLSRSFEIISQDEFKNADLVFITDGYCNVSESFIEKFNNLKKEKEFEVFTVAIALNSQDQLKEIKEWSDRLWETKSLNEDISESLFKEIL